MNKRLCWITVLFVLAGCGHDSTTQNLDKTQATEAHKKLADDDCMEPMYKASIPKDVVNKRRLLGELDPLAARAIEDSTWFATRCKVLITEQDGSPPKACKPANPDDMIMLKNMTMTISKSDDVFDLTLTSPSGRAIKSTMVAKPSTNAGSFDYLESVKTTPDNLSFYVYFGDSLPGQPTTIHPGALVKKYWVQVYYADASSDCSRYKPSAKVVDGYEGDPGGSGEGGVGGGTEPNHR